MQIVFNIAEDSNVELVKGEYELVQGECCVTELKFNFPATIKGVPIDYYEKQIEFGECKELGECAKFVDDINGDSYELGENCTAFKKIMVQLVLTYNGVKVIKWKTIPVALEFHESVNAEGGTFIQAQLLNLAEIKSEWENYIKANTFRVVSNAAGVPKASEAVLGETIFYLGANMDATPYLTYGHYYKCNQVSGGYKWTDLTQDPSLAGVADGVREINKNQTLQFWKGTAAELENEVPQEGVAYIAEDVDLEDVLNEYVPNIKVKTAESVNGFSIVAHNATGYKVYKIGHVTITKREPFASADGENLGGPAIPKVRYYFDVDFQVTSNTVELVESGVEFALQTNAAFGYYHEAIYNDEVDVALGGANWNKAPTHDVRYECTLALDKAETAKKAEVIAAGQSLSIVEGTSFDTHYAPITQTGLYVVVVKAGGGSQPYFTRLVYVVSLTEDSGNYNFGDICYYDSKSKTIRLGQTYYEGNGQPRLHKVYRITE